MENSKLQTAAQDHDSQGHEKVVVAPEHVIDHGIAPLDLFFSGASDESQDGGPTRLMRSASLAHSANGAVRAIAFKRAQQTYGNRFVQRAIAGGSIQRHNSVQTTEARETVDGAPAAYTELMMRLRVGNLNPMLLAAGMFAVVGVLQTMRGKDFELAGYKGAPLSFRPWDGQLRQPVLLVDDRSLVSISPQPGFLHQFDELDTLGVDQPETQCRLK